METLKHNLGLARLTAVHLHLLMNHIAGRVCKRRERWSRKKFIGGQTRGQDDEWPFLLAVCMYQDNLRQLRASEGATASFVCRSSMCLSIGHMHV